MGKPKAPSPPDPKVTAAAQTANNIGTAIANQNLSNINQVTPFGNLTFDQTGTHQFTDPNSGDVFDIPTFTATQTLSPEQQNILDQNNTTNLNLSTLGANQSGRLDDLLSRPFNPQDLPARREVSANPNLTTEIGDAGSITRTFNTDFSADRQHVEDALFERLNPQLQQDRDALEQRLASQGIRIGSEAYQDAIGNFDRQSNDARLAAILSAGQEQSRLAGLDAQQAAFENAAQAQAFSQLGQQAQFGNQAQLDATNADIALTNAQNTTRQGALSEDLAIRNQPLNEITALLSGSQIQSPNFINPQTQNIPTTDRAGIEFASFNAANNQFQNDRNRLDRIISGGIGGLSSFFL